MKQQLVGAFAAIAASSVASAQNAVQWRVQDGGNGHWYHVEDLGQNFTTIEACVAAIALRGGLPCVFESQQEWDWWCVHPNGQPWGGVIHHGLYRASYQPWRTYLGSSPLFTAWGPTLPNNPASDYVIATAAPDGCSSPNPTPCWEDYGTIDTGFRRWAIEWSADCNNDGLVDFGQIRDGTLADANGNNIPDCCESGQSCSPCPGDVVEDHVVNGVDLAAVINAWGTNGGAIPRTDTNHDGIVDGVDLANVLGSWGTCP